LAKLSRRRKLNKECDQTAAAQYFLISSKIIRPVEYLLAAVLNRRLSTLDNFISSA
jgi:hypothetical protein